MPPLLHFIGTRRNFPSTPRTGDVITTKSRRAKWRALFHPSSVHNFPRIILGCSVESCYLISWIFPRLTFTTWTLGLGFLWGSHCLFISSIGLVRALQPHSPQPSRKCLPLLLLHSSQWIPKTFCVTDTSGVWALVFTLFQRKKLSLPTFDQHTYCNSVQINVGCLFWNFSQNFFLGHFMDFVLSPFSDIFEVCSCDISKFNLFKSKIFRKTETWWI